MKELDKEFDIEIYWPEIEEFAKFNEGSNTSGTIDYEALYKRQKMYIDWALSELKMLRSKNKYLKDCEQ